METSKKRTREGEGDEGERGTGKRRSAVHDFSDDQTEYEFYDGIGVFDFPWLKEGMIFIGDEGLGADEKLATYFSDESFDQASSSSCSFVKNLFADHGYYNYFPDDCKSVDDGGFGFWSFDDFEPIYGLPSD